MNAPSHDLGQLRTRFIAAQLQGDRREALRLVIEEGVERGASVGDVQLVVIQEAQREIGRMWQENAISIAEEHMATAISNMALSHLYDRAARLDSVGKKVIVACVEGELHDFPARLVSDALDLAGFEVRYLGANVPTTSLISLIAAERPDAVALSTTMAFNLESLRRAVAALRAAFPQLSLVVGGGAVDWSGGVARELGVDGSAANAADTVNVLRSILGVG